MAKLASYPDDVKLLVESDAKDTKVSPEYGADDPLWTTTEYEEIHHQYPTPHVPVQPLSTVSYYMGWITGNSRKDVLRTQ